MLLRALQLPNVHVNCSTAFLIQSPALISTPQNYWGFLVQLPSSKLVLEYFEGKK